MMKDEWHSTGRSADPAIALHYLDQSNNKSAKIKQCSEFHKM